MMLQDTYRIEVAKWDALSRADRSHENLLLEHADFAAHARRVARIAPVARFVGDVRGRDVLEPGCGFGALSTLLARSGARVSALDLSPGSIDVARRRAKLHGVDDAIDFAVAAGERLPYSDASFDVVVGKSVLHHMEAALAAPELRRVLRPGGRAAFVEPLGTQPVLRFAREHLPYPHKNPRGADRPLSYEDIRAWTAPFARADYKEIELLMMVGRAVGARRPPAVLTRINRRLLARWPRLRRWCRSVVLTMQK